MKEIKFPSESEFFTNLILQRTGPFIKLGGADALNNWFSFGDKKGLVEFLQSKNMVHTYLNLLLSELSLELEQLKKNIPKEKLGRIVSVGPGNGLMELLILAQGVTSKILLIDIEKTDVHYHGFNEKGSGYASLATTKKFLEINVDRPIEIILCNPVKDPIPDFRFSLFISLLSMGFHYPCNDYVNFIIKNAETDAVAVIDKRRDVFDDGYDKLRDFFSLKQALPWQKSDRVFLKKNPT
jgi:hypothetical protein